MDVVAIVQNTWPSIMEIINNAKCVMDAASDTTSQSDDRFKSHHQFQPIGILY
jgi:hypothetical protein